MVFRLSIENAHEFYSQLFVHICVYRCGGEYLKRYFKADQEEDTITLLHFLTLVEKSQLY